MASIGGPSAGLGREASAIQTQALGPSPNLDIQRNHHSGHELPMVCQKNNRTPHTIEPPTSGGGWPNEYARNPIAATNQSEESETSGRGFVFPFLKGWPAPLPNKMNWSIGPLRAEFTSKQRLVPKHLNSQSPRMLSFDLAI
jgi:hypothetical protein